MQKFAIVIQGPDCGDRTFQIAQYLLDNNDDRTSVVLSIWKKDDTAMARYHSSLVTKEGEVRVYVVASEEPKFEHNLMHRFSQRVSTYREIKFAINELGATHILKLRSDNLIRIPNVCAHLCDKQKQYPPVTDRNGIPLEPRRERLIVSQTGCTEELMWRNFHVSDHWMFGRSEEMVEWYEDLNGYLSEACHRHFVEHIPQEKMYKLQTLLDPVVFTNRGMSPEPDFAQF